MTRDRVRRLQMEKRKKEEEGEISLVVKSSAGTKIALAQTTHL